MIWTTRRRTSKAGRAASFCFVCVCVREREREKKRGALAREDRRPYREEQDTRGDGIERFRFTERDSRRLYFSKLPRLAEEDAEKLAEQQTCFRPMRAWFDDSRNGPLRLVHGAFPAYWMELGAWEPWRAVRKLFLRGDPASLSYSKNKKLSALGARAGRWQKKNTHTPRPL